MLQYILMYSNVYLVGPNRRGAWAQGKTKEGTQQGFDRSSQKTLIHRDRSRARYRRQAAGKRGLLASAAGRAAGKHGRAGGQAASAGGRQAWARPARAAGRAASIANAS